MLKEDFEFIDFPVREDYTVTILKITINTN